MNNLPDDIDADSEDTPLGLSLNLPINPQHFITFLALIDANGRIGIAARNVGLSQPAVTHQLSELERRLRVRLLDRKRGRPARITRAGRVFERYARNIVGTQAAMYAELEQMSRSVGGHMRVGSSPGPGEHWLPPLLCAFREEHAKLSLELHVADARSIMDQVYDHELELGFVGGRWARPGLEFEAIWRDEFVLVASPEHSLAQQNALKLRDLEGAAFISQEPGTGLRLTFEQELDDRGLTLEHFDVLAELGNQESVKTAVAAGWGIGCVWKQSIAAELALGSLVALDVDGFHPDSHYYVVRRSSHRLSRRGQALLKYLQTVRDDAAADHRRATRIQ